MNSKRSRKALSALSVFGAAAMAVSGFGAQMCVYADDDDDDYEEPEDIDPDDVGIVSISRTFPDSNLRSIINSYDYDEDGMLSRNELSDISDISVDDDSVVSDFTGVDVLPELTDIDIGISAAYASRIRSIDLGNCGSLETFTLAIYLDDADDIPPSVRLSLSGCSSLTDISVDSADISYIDLSRNSRLSSLALTNCVIGSLDLSRNSSLSDIDLSYSKMYALTVSRGTPDLTGVTYDLGTVSKFDLRTLKGFDPAKASDWTDAVYDSKTCSLSGFTSETVSYTYDCGGGQRGEFEFTVIPDPSAPAVSADESQTGTSDTDTSPANDTAAVKPADSADTSSQPVNTDTKDTASDNTASNTSSAATASTTAKTKTLTVGSGKKYTNITAAITYINKQIKAKNVPENGYIISVTSKVKESKALTLPNVPIKIKASKKTSVVVPSVTAKGALTLKNITLATAEKKAAPVTAKSTLVMTSCTVGKVTAAKAVKMTSCKTGTVNASRALTAASCTLGKVTVKTSLTITKSTLTSLTAEGKNYKKSVTDKSTIKGDLTVKGNITLSKDSTVKGKTSVTGKIKTA